MKTSLELWLKFLPLFGGAIAFIWGVIQFSANQNTQTETRRIEARQPFLKRQLKLYTEATQMASIIATSKDQGKIDSAKSRFWTLYWGELALVEDKQVEAAMVELGRKIKGEKVTKVRDGKTVELTLKDLSLALAHSCRDSLADSWGVADWRNPR